MQIVQRSKTYLKDVTENTSKVILMKLVDVLQAGLKETKDFDEIHTKNLNEKEVPALQYLGGYIISNLYRKLKSSKNCQSEECQQALSLLWACKCDVEINGNTKLISALNRGGLCIINETVEKIFVVAEKYFQINTQKFGLTVIDVKMIVEKLKSFSYIRGFFNDIKHSSETPVSEEVLNVTLCNILHLYIKVRSFTFAKNKVEKHKQKSRKTNLRL